MIKLMCPRLNINSSLMHNLKLRLLELGVSVPSLLPSQVKEAARMPMRSEGLEANLVEVISALFVNASSSSVCQET